MGSQLPNTSTAIRGLAMETTVDLQLFVWSPLIVSERFNETDLLDAQCAQYRPGVGTMIGLVRQQPDANDMQKSSSPPVALDMA